MSVSLTSRARASCFSNRLLDQSFEYLRYLEQNSASVVCKYWYKVIRNSREKAASTTIQIAKTIPWTVDLNLKWMQNLSGEIRGSFHLVRIPSSNRIFIEKNETSRRIEKRKNSILSGVHIESAHLRDYVIHASWMDLDKFITVTHFGSVAIWKCNVAFQEGDGSSFNVQRVRQWEVLTGEELSCHPNVSIDTKSSDQYLYVSGFVHRNNLGSIYRKRFWRIFSLSTGIEIWTHTESWAKGFKKGKGKSYPQWSPTDMACNADRFYTAEGRVLTMSDKGPQPIGLLNIADKENPKMDYIAVNERWVLTSVYHGKQMKRDSHIYIFDALSGAFIWKIKSSGNCSPPNEEAWLSGDFVITWTNQALHICSIPLRKKISSIEMANFGSTSAQVQHKDSIRVVHASGFGNTLYIIGKIACMVAPGFNIEKRLAIIFKGSVQKNGSLPTTHSGHYS